MLYFAIERQATAQMQFVNGTVTVPSFLTNPLLTNENVIPVFLSRVHAYIHLKTSGLLSEFKLVTSDNIELDTYRHICKEEKNTGKKLLLSSCRIVLGIGKQNGEQGLAFFNKVYKLHETFFDEDIIRKEVEKAFGDDAYHAIVEDDKLDENKIVELGDKVIGDANLSVKASTDKNQDIEPESALQNIGAMHVFILKDKDQAAFTIKENDGQYVLTFVNKLDAIIFSLMRKEIDGSNYDVVAINSNNIYFDLLRLGYQKGQIKFRVALGFSGVDTPLGVKWAKHEENTSIPSMQLMDCTLEEIENGFDLAHYLVFMANAEERELALTGIVKTNFTPTTELLNSAKKMLSDMKANTLKVNEDNSVLHHRLIFVAQ